MLFGIRGLRFIDPTPVIYAYFYTQVLILYDYTNFQWGRVTMDFEESLNQVAAKVQEQKSIIDTEEATKTAFVLPFIGQVLGYDVLNLERLYQNLPQTLA